MVRAVAYLDDKEWDLVNRTLSVVQTLRGTKCIEDNIGRLGWLARVAQSYPSLMEWTQLGDQVRRPEDLIDRLVHQDRAAFELHLPTKATVGRAFLVAKIQLFRSFILAMQRSCDPYPTELVAEVRHELDQSVYTKLGEEVLIEMLYALEVPDPIKEHAARILIGIWDKPGLTEVTQFSPVLEAMWFARNKVHVQLGTLMGVYEMFRLAQGNAPEELMDFFGRDGLSPSERASFEEFLFGLLFEELTRLRREMEERHLSAVDPKRAGEILGMDCTRFVQVTDSASMYESYRRRALACEYRRMASGPGPRRTAEEYLMQAVVARQVNL
ncbi:MAG: hypothetical protein HUU55_22785 [Myxococcales bacterium]|nr:hypothetical protein [Myxococcales bacterium]